VSYFDFVNGDKRLPAVTLRSHDGFAFRDVCQRGNHYTGRHSGVVKAMTSVLFLCDDNAVESIMAESILRSVGGSRFACHSAGVHPVPIVHPLVLDFLRERRLPISGLRPKAMREFLAPAASRLDFVITLSEAAADEAAARFGAGPVVAHWNVDESEGAVGEVAVRDLFWTLQRRIRIFASLPLASAPRRSIQHRVDAIATWQ
jgi:arsenate reductase